MKNNEGLKDGCQMDNLDQTSAFQLNHLQELLLKMSFEQSDPGTWDLGPEFAWQGQVQ